MPEIALLSFAPKPRNKSSASWRFQSRVQDFALSMRIVSPLRNKTLLNTTSAENLHVRLSGWRVLSDKTGGSNARRVMAFTDFQWNVDTLSASA
jgi:hypothetical protein